MRGAWLHGVLNFPADLELDVESTRKGVNSAADLGTLSALGVMHDISSMIR